MEGRGGGEGGEAHGVLTKKTSMVLSQVRLSDKWSGWDSKVTFSSQVFRAKWRFEDKLVRQIGLVIRRETLQASEWAQTSDYRRT
jgi:hypothetical protein